MAHNPPEYRARGLFIIALLIGGAAAGASFYLAGASLSFLLASLFLAALIAPPLLSIRPFSALAGIIIAFGAIGLLAGWHGWIVWLLVITSLICAEITGARLLVRFRIAPIAASAIITTLACLWLTWPIWGAPRMPGLIEIGRASCRERV